MKLAVCFLAEDFSKISTRELFTMLMEIEPVNKEFKRIFTSYLLRRKGNEIPPWASVNKEELEDALLNLELDDGILDEVSEEELPDLVAQLAMADILLKYYSPTIYPFAVRQYAALWHCILSDNPKDEIKAIFREAQTMSEYYRNPIYIGLVEAIYKLHRKLDPGFVEKMFNRFLNMGNGNVRKSAYKYGYEIFGPDWMQGALRDPNSSVRKWAMGFLERGGKPLKGGRKKVIGDEQTELF